MLAWKLACLRKGSYPSYLRLHWRKIYAQNLTLWVFIRHIDTPYPCPRANIQNFFRVLERT